MAGSIIINVPFNKFFEIVKTFTIGFDSMFNEFERMLDSPEFTRKYPTHKITIKMKLIIL